MKARACPRTPFPALFSPYSGSRGLLSTFRLPQVTVSASLRSPPAQDPTRFSLSSPPASGKTKTIRTGWAVLPTTQAKTSRTPGLCLSLQADGGSTCLHGVGVGGSCPLGTGPAPPSDRAPPSFSSTLQPTPASPLESTQSPRLPAAQPSTDSSQAVHSPRCPVTNALPRPLQPPSSLHSCQGHSDSRPSLR